MYTYPPNLRVGREAASGGFCFVRVRCVHYGVVTHIVYHAFTDK